MTVNTKETPREDVNSSAKTLMVLQVALEVSRFTDIVKASGLARSTVHRILRGLTDSGFLVTDDKGHYHPGPSSLRLAATSMANTDVVAIARPIIANLVSRVGATAHLAIRVGDEAVYLSRADSPSKPYQLSSRVGLGRQLYCTALGKSLLATETDAAVAAYAARVPMLPRTRRTITDVDALIAEVHRIRVTGWSIDNEESEPGIICLATPIVTLDGVRHAISVSVLAMDVPLQELVSHARDVQAAAAEISAQLGVR